MPRTLASLLLLIAAVAVAACASNAVPGVAPRPAGGGPALSADLVPFETPPAAFVQRPAGRVLVRTERTATGARLVIDTPGAQGRRLDLTQTTGAIVFSDGPGRALELVRLGATPGTSWRSGQSDVVFDGWERVETPTATYDAARIRTLGGVGDLRVEDAWWFAPGVGLVRYRQDNGGIFSLEMLRAD